MVDKTEEGEKIRKQFLLCGWYAFLVTSRNGTLSRKEISSFSSLE